MRRTKTKTILVEKTVELPDAFICDFCGRKIDVIDINQPAERFETVSLEISNPLYRERVLAGRFSAPGYLVSTTIRVHRDMCGVCIDRLFNPR